MGPADNPTTAVAPTGSASTSIFSDLTARASSGNVSDVSQVIQPTPAIKKLDYMHSSITKMKEPLDDTNWVVWRELIRRIFHLCGVEPYVYGTFKRPDPDVDLAAFNIWDFNDVYAQILITNNISKSQMVHVTRLNTAYEIWKSLEAIHETKDYQVAITIQRALFRKCASEDDDIIEHLGELKKQWERLNVLEDADFRITDIQFKTIIASSLPSSWDVFTEPYVGRRVGVVEQDPKKLASSQEFIGILKEEYMKRKERNGNTQKVYYTNNNSNNQKNRTRGQRKPTGMLCRNCKHDSHNTDDCRWLGKPQCSKCNWFGHVDADCRRQLKRKRDNEGEGRKDKKPKKEHVNNTSEEQANMTMETAKQGTITEIAFVSKDVDNPCNHNQCNTSSNAVNEEPMVLCYWLADSATTSHVTSVREIFTTYEPLTKTVSGVGNVQTQAEGKGTIKIRSTVNGKDYNLTLTDVLYIPNNIQSLLSLGRWDKAGGSYHGEQGKLRMNANNGDIVATGTRLNNNLYRLNNFVPQPTAVTPKSTYKSISHSTFNATEPTPTREIWHRRFGHLGNSSIQLLHDKGMVNGLNIDLSSPIFDCEACVQAKQHVTPFPKASVEIRTKPGEITHMDLWGKYPVQSIHGNQYFHSFLDDSTRLPRITFLKLKDDAITAVKNHVAYLKARGLHPNAFRCDEGSEFVNDELIRWLQEQGIELQKTAPYSPSQNGAAERLNRTLLELARAMMIANDVPAFLWEYAIKHAAYLRERAPAKALPGKTPYEAWHGHKPNVSSLREFGSPVYVLLQGQKRLPKLQPRSKQQIFMGYDDGSKSILYFNPATRKVLTSRNFQFLTHLPEQPGTPEPIHVDLSPAVPREGEYDGVQSTLQPGSQHNNEKHEEPHTESEETGRKLRKRTSVDYKKLNDPFSEEEGNDTYQIHAEAIFQATLGPEDPGTLKEAKTLKDWPQWEDAIRSELTQLDQFKTWELVECPRDAIPIPNKWVLRKKYNREGELTKYKARLVVKGCAQRPGFDYTDTFSPVVRLETIRAILAIVPIKQLKMRQMDVKGAYLNGILQEKVYMRQPEGFSDGTNRVCWLHKTLYGLKQSGREWNKELDRRLKEKGFHNLLSDPCAYIRRNGDDLEIVTVWVDDLMLFATSINLMEQLAEDLKSIFDVTDLGEPSKIVGIEITHRKHSLTISQPQYIDSILRKHGMQDANPVTTPLDSNVKLEINKNEREGNDNNEYASLIGSLQYLTIATRPDIAYAVNRLASFTANPSFEHYNAAKRVLRYLKGTRNFGITYRDQNNRLIGPNDSNIFYGFSDSAFANAEDQKSISGYVFLANMGAITWMSKKQSTIALSTTEAEYVALSEAAREAKWLHHLYGELGFTQVDPITLLGDNDGSISLTKNPQLHKRTKHIDLRWHWIRELVKDGLINVIDCRNPQQTADIMTKPLPRPKFSQHVNELGLSDAYAV